MSKASPNQDPQQPGGDRSPREGHKKRRMDEARSKSPGGQVSGSQTGNYPKPDQSGQRARLMPEGEADSRRESGRTMPELQERTEPGEGYVRLRLRYDQGELSIVGVKRVEGPFLKADRLQAGFAYEVTRGSRRISVETVPDLGVQRSFPHPTREGELGGHHVTVLTNYEFNVRIPADQFSRRNLRNLEIALYEIIESPEVATMDARSLGVQFAKEVRVLGRMKGIQLGELPHDLQKQVKEVLR